MKRRRIRYNKRAGGERRGNNTDRRNRKLWMLKTFGTGKTVPCTHCEKKLTYDTVEADRVDPGGPYRRENIVPSCSLCNKKRFHGMKAGEKSMAQEMADYFKQNPRRRKYRSIKKIKSKFKIYRRRRVA